MTPPKKDDHWKAIASFLGFGPPEPTKSVEKRDPQVDAAAAEPIAAASAAPEMTAEDRLPDISPRADAPLPTSAFATPPQSPAAAAPAPARAEKPMPRASQPSSHVVRKPDRPKGHWGQLANELGIELPEAESSEAEPEFAPPKSVSPSPRQEPTPTPPPMRTQAPAPTPAAAPRHQPPARPPAPRPAPPRFRGSDEMDDDLPNIDDIEEIDEPIPAWTAPEASDDEPTDEMLDVDVDETRAVEEPRERGGEEAPGGRRRRRRGRGRGRRDGRGRPGERPPQRGEEPSDGIRPSRVRDPLEVRDIDDERIDFDDVGPHDDRLHDVGPRSNTTSLPRGESRDTDEFGEVSEIDADESRDEPSADDPTRRRGRRRRGRRRRGAGSSPETRGPESRGPETRGPETRGPETRGPETRGRPQAAPEREELDEVVPEIHDEFVDDDDGPISMEPLDSDDESGLDAHRKIPTWSDAIGAIVDVNMEARHRDPGGGRGRGRGRRN